MEMTDVVVADYGPSAWTILAFWLLILGAAGAGGLLGYGLGLEKSERSIETIEKDVEDAQRRSDSDSLGEG